jgi:hypothetical protein
MESPRITLARALELGVHLSWREASAIVHEAVVATRATEGVGPARVTAESCVLTRGGDVVLVGTAAQARPEAVVRLLDDLLTSCSNPGRFADAVANGTALDMIEDLSQHTTPKRRRIEVASVALRGLAAAAEAAREGTAPGNAMAPPISTSAAQGTGPNVTPRPASFSMDRPSATPQVEAVRTATDVRRGYRAPFEWVKRASAAVLVCSVLAVAAGGILILQMPATRRSAVEPSEPAVEPPAIVTPAGLGGQTPLARPVPALLHEVADPPSLLPSTTRSSPRIEDRRAPLTRAQDSIVPSNPLPAGGPKTPGRNTATVAESRSRYTSSATAGLVAPDAANSAGAPPPAVELPSVLPSPGPSPGPSPSPSAAASSPAETVGSAPTDLPASTVAQYSREAEARAIENVLGRYRIAFNELDAGAASAVWPAVNEKTLAKAFERLESHDVSFESCQIEIFSVLAEAACSGRARYVPKVGNRTPKDEARRWRFSLRKASGAWLIDSVEAR